MATYGDTEKLHQQQQPEDAENDIWRTQSERASERASAGVLLLRQIKRLRFMPRGCEHFFFEMER